MEKTKKDHLYPVEDHLERAIYALDNTPDGVISRGQRLDLVEAITKARNLVMEIVPDINQ